MMPAGEVNTPVASNNGMSKATSAVYLKPLENQPTERPPSGCKPQHQQVTRLSHNTGIHVLKGGALYRQRKQERKKYHRLLYFTPPLKEHPKFSKLAMFGGEIWK